MKCFLCETEEAERDLNIPCAPGGKLSVCGTCNRDPEMIQKVFNKYKAGNLKRINVFKTPGNPGN